MCCMSTLSCFFFNDTATTEIYTYLHTLSLHDALPISPGGEVHIGWDVMREDGQVRLRMKWVERGGPPVTPPTRRGFGTRMIERGLAADRKSTRLNSSH